MPAGMTVSAYIKFILAAGVSTAIGSQLVHRKYKPLSDLEDYIEREILSRSDEEQIKIRAAIQARQDRIEYDISKLPPETQEKVRSVIFQEEEQRQVN